MNHIRVRLVLLTSWLIVFYCADKLVETAYLGDIVYPFALISVIIMIALGITRGLKQHLGLVLTIPLIVYLALKGWLVGYSGPSVFASTFLEVCSILLTITLTYWVSLSLVDFERAVERITIRHKDRVLRAAMAGDPIYREVRRARNHNRPLGLMAIGVEDFSIDTAIDRMVQEVQSSMMKQYMLSVVSKTLCNHLEDCTTIVQQDDHFLIVLPETKPEEMPIVIGRIRQKVAEDIGVNLKIGTASLPEDGYTFEGLLDKATRGMDTNPESELFIDFGKLPIERHIP
jgi:GGDEF domain-containing protein